MFANFHFFSYFYFPMFCYMICFFVVLVGSAEFLYKVFRIEKHLKLKKYLVVGATLFLTVIFGNVRLYEYHEMYRRIIVLGDLGLFRKTLKSYKKIYHCYPTTREGFIVLTKENLGKKRLPK